jgi:hypothetical protein
MQERIWSTVLFDNGVPPRGIRAPVIPGVPATFGIRWLLSGSWGFTRMRVGCSRLATPTILVKVWSAVRFSLPGSELRAECRADELTKPTSPTYWYRQPNACPPLTERSSK